MLTYNTPSSINGTSPASATNMNGAGADSKPIPGSMTHATNISNSSAGPKHRHIWLVTGPAGCGKSTVAQYLASSLNLPYLEGDEFHPKANVDKMASGIPLTDADRWDWLTLLREESLRQLAAGAEGVVLTCSALKRKYRDVIRVAPYYSHDVLLHFIYLHAPETVLIERVGARKGHYMGVNMVHSQFTILEPPTDEETDVISVDVSKSEEEVQRDALDRVLETMDEAA
ncbi:thermoresistant glucokinase family carbohydrate kinase [Xylariales sp. AK1849]|nr:thermoresistant glucokinase family carbohydrate kinase [Xylariales sp. AK1849]